MDRTRSEYIVNWPFLVKNNRFSIKVEQHHVTPTQREVENTMKMTNDKQLQMITGKGAYPLDSSGNVDFTW